MANYFSICCTNCGETQNYNSLEQHCYNCGHNEADFPLKNEGKLTAEDYAEMMEQQERYYDFYGYEGAGAV